MSTLAPLVGCGSGRRTAGCPSRDALGVEHDLDASVCSGWFSRSCRSPPCSSPRGDPRGGAATLNAPEAAPPGSPLHAVSRPFPALSAEGSIHSIRTRPLVTRSRTVPSRSVRDARHRGAQRGERVRRRMPVGVLAPDLDRGDLGLRAGEQRGQAGIVAAVVGDLEDVDVGELERVRDLGLRVGGQEDVEAPDARERDDRRGGWGCRRRASRAAAAAAQTSVGCRRGPVAARRGRGRRVRGRPRCTVVASRRRRRGSAAAGRRGRSRAPSPRGRSRRG